MRVCVVAEFYPRAADPVLGVWTHRQTLAARDAGAEVRVIVLYRPVPPRARAGDPAALREALAQPRHATLDGLEVDYVRFLSPPRPRTYGSWGTWATPPLAVALRLLRRRFPFDLVHAHNAVPAGEAVRAAHVGAPLVVSVHGGDVLFTASRYASGDAAVRRAFGAARLVLANSAGIERAVRDLGAQDTRVVHLGADLPAERGRTAEQATLVTLGHLVARKRHADVIRALALLRDRRPDLRYLIIGDGPERGPLRRLATELDVAERVEFAGQLDPAEAMTRAHECALFVMPSIDEAFGVAYIEAMAGGVPAIGCAGEPGPEEIAGVGGGMRMVPPENPAALAGEIESLLADPAALGELGTRARATVEAAFTWERCGSATVAAYEEALRSR